MRKLITKYRYYFLLLFVFLVAGCGSALKNMSNDAVLGLSENASTLTKNLTKGITDQLADPATKKHITNLLDSIVISLDSTLEPRISKLETNVLNHKVVLFSDSLIEALTGNQLKLNVGALQKELVGKSADDIIKIRDSFKGLLDDVLSDDTNNRIGKLRDQLLGAKTDSAISRIIDHATTKVTNQIDKLNATAKGDISYIGKYGGYLLLLLGGIAAIIIFIVWWNKRRYLQMTTLLAKQIHNIPDQKVYDKVTAKIKDEAISSGLEPHLRKILNANGLIGNANWKSKEKEME